MRLSRLNTLKWFPHDSKQPSQWPTKVWLHHLLFFFFSPFTLYSILCSSHSGSLLFLEYAKHTPTSGPLQLIFSLPGICIPLSNYYSNVTSFYLFLSLWCPQDPQESFGCTADPHYPWKSKHRYWVDTEDQPFFSVDSKDVSWEDSRDWVQVPHN